eukprot:gene3192-biopygen11894
MRIISLPDGRFDSSSIPVAQHPPRDMSSSEPGHCYGGIDDCILFCHRLTSLLREEGWCSRPPDAVLLRYFSPQGGFPSTLEHTFFDIVRSVRCVV